MATVKYRITHHWLTIREASLVSKEKFNVNLNSIQAIHPDCEVWKRSRKSLCYEWAFHNFIHSSNSSELLELDSIGSLETTLRVVFGWLVYWLVK